MNGQIQAYILEIARWARFIGIVGFVGIGLMIILGFYMGAAMSALSRPEFGDVSPMGGLGGGLITFIYILMAALYFFPVLYLYKGAIGLRDGIRTGDIATLEEGFRNLKSHYKFIGILVLIVISIYGVLFVGGLVVAALL